MGEVPRHEFVPHEQVGDAYKNRPLSIDHGQTISQPFIVALMAELLQLKDTDKVLEVGTGSGYQAAILICARPEGVLDRDRSRLGEAARNVLKRLGYANVETKIGDGYQGWAEHAPLMPSLSLRPPISSPGAGRAAKAKWAYGHPRRRLYQALMVVTKKPDGTPPAQPSCLFGFAPLIRE